MRHADCLLTNIRTLLKQKRLSTLQLADYYTYVRHLDVDEETVAHSLKAVGLDAFAARLHQVLHESLYLEYGFMPIAPIDDWKTEGIRKRIQQIYHF